MEDKYNRDVMSHTLRATFLGGRRVVKRSQVVDAMEELIDVKELTAIYKTGQAADWYLTFKSTEEVSKFGAGGEHELRGERRVFLESIDNRTVKFRVHWYPLHMKMELVEEYMSQFGQDVVLSEEYETYGAVRVKTGVISGQMKSTETMFQAIPYKDRIFNRWVLITVLGRQTICLKCGEKGHQRAGCNSGKRPRDYADATRRGIDGNMSAETTRGERAQPGSGGLGSDEDTQASTQVQETTSGESTQPSADVPERGESAQLSDDVPMCCEGAQLSADVQTVDDEDMVEKTKKRSRDEDEDENRLSDGSGKKLVIDSEKTVTPPLSLPIQPPEKGIVSVGQ